MNEEGTSKLQPTVVALIASGNADAAAGFYDAHAPGVREYCSELCPPELVDEATRAALIDFLGRASSAADDVDPVELLLKASRTAAAARIDVADSDRPECRAIPDLIAARINDELVRDDGQLRRHLRRCQACADLAMRMAEADDAFARTPQGTPASEVRAAWLELAAGRRPVGAPAGPEPVANWEPPAPEADAPEPLANWEPPAPEANAPEPQTTAALGPGPPADPVVGSNTVRVRARRGGLVGAARRALGSRKS
jgi:hypothetical protein